MSDDLRRRAEAAVDERRGAPGGPLTTDVPGDLTELLHELNVHQIELEAQNEELFRAQLELDAIRRRYSDLYDQAPVGYVTLSDAGLIVQANLTAARLLAVERAALMKRPFSRFVKVTSQDRYYLLRRQAGRSTQVQSGELELIADDGRHFWADVVARSNAESGTPVVHLILSDISERKAAQQRQMLLETRIQQAEKMDLVGRLAGGVAHDFNNMLSIVLGYIELALQRLDPDTILHRELSSARTAAEHSAELTRQLLAFARKQVVAPEVLDLDEVTRELLAMLPPLLGEDISVVWQPHGSLWLVEMDHSQLDQILTNLCLNARDAIVQSSPDTGRPGVIRVRTENRTVGPADIASHPDWPEGEYVELSVSDNGPGMGEATIEHIFEPFFTTKGAHGGIGLGLATVFGAVSQNGGFIEVTSRPDGGTRFSVNIPRSSASRHPAAPADHPIAARGSETVLLVEDQAAILAVVAQMLSRSGYEVLSANTAAQAFELARAHEGAIHLVISDVVMPGMNGRELMDQLASLHPECRQLFMSGYTADVIAKQQVLAEGLHFLQKPFTMLELENKVREVLDPEQGAEVGTGTPQPA